MGGPGGHGSKIYFLHKGSYVNNAIFILNGGPGGGGGSGAQSGSSGVYGSDGEVVDIQM
jgi:hypothetical protein